MNFLKHSNKWTVPPLLRSTVLDLSLDVLHRTAPLLRAPFGAQEMHDVLSRKIWVLEDITILWNRPHLPPHTFFAPAEGRTGSRAQHSPTESLLRIKSTSNSSWWQILVHSKSLVTKIFSFYLSAFLLQLQHPWSLPFGNALYTHPVIFHPGIKCVKPSWKFPKIIPPSPLESVMGNNGEAAWAPKGGCWFLGCPADWRHGGCCVTGCLSPSVCFIPLSPVG